MTNKTEFNQIVVALNRTFGAISLMKERIEMIEKNFNKTEEIIEKLQQKMKELIMNKPEETFIFESSDIISFLEGHSDKFRKSKYFYARNLAWFVELEVVKAIEEKAFLYIHLKVLNLSGDKKWSINVNHEMRIKNQSGKQDKCFEMKNNVLKKDGLVRFQFISVEEVMNDGFIKNDTIKIQIYVKADRLM